MRDNKVSEKAIWEGSITPDDETPFIASQMQAQPQMMYCYKCNNAIPADSKFCPYCQIELYTKCPKCGAKYSSQYHACNKCGTNREEYLLVQRREQERKEMYFKENEGIMKAEEYKITYSILSEAFKDYEKKANNMGCVLLIIIPLFLIIMFTLFCVHPILGFILIMVSPFLHDYFKEDKNKCHKHLQKYISGRINNQVMISDDFINMVSCQGKERLSDCCIIAYRKQYGLPINYEWHNM